MLVKRGFMLAVVLLAALNLANFDSVNAASSVPPGIKDGAYMWYKSVDFTHANRTDYTYVEFEKVHEHTAEIAIRTGLLSSNESEWSDHPPLYGHLDFESGSLTLVGATSGAGLSFWASPQNAQRNGTSGFPPDNKGYGSVDCWTFESKTNGQLWWYDKVTGLLIETSFPGGDLIVILYETNIPVGIGAANQWFVSLETPASTMTYAAVLIGSLAVAALAIIGIVRFRKKTRTSQGVLAKRCPSCGYKNRDDAVFCSSCGSSLTTPGPPVIKPEHLASVASVMKSEPAVGVVTPPRELERTTWVHIPVETRKVCETCGHLNPEWIRNYCVRCAAKLMTD
jgi:hypothetical protein